MLKPATENEIKIYELYLQRIMKEGDWNWARFKIYFGFNSGALIVMGFLLKPYLSTTFQNIPNQLLGIIIILSFIGLFFSISWFFVNLDGRKWQNLMNNVIEKLEFFIFEEKECALYGQIIANYNTNKIKIDVVDINLYIVFIFLFIWLLAGFLSLYTYWAVR